MMVFRRFSLLAHIALFAIGCLAALPVFASASSVSITSNSKGVTLSNGIGDEKGVGDRFYPKKSDETSEFLAVL